jgi:hypothetical protein
LALGFVDGATGYFLFPGQRFPPSSFAIIIAGLFLTFWWYRLDSDSRAYRRTPLMSTAAVGPFLRGRTTCSAVEGFNKAALATLIFIVVSIGYSAMVYLGRLAVQAMRT